MGLSIRTFLLFYLYYFPIFRGIFPEFYFFYNKKKTGYDIIRKEREKGGQVIYGKFCISKYH